MTWISCCFCHQCPCACAVRPLPYYPTPTTTTLTWPPETRLSDADIERIAERVVEKLRPKRKRKP